jgi:hypothetical protein
VTSDLISDIITQDHFNVRILSIREVQNLNPRKLQQALIYAVRPSRPAGTPKLKGLYVFGPKDATPISRFDRHSNSATHVALSYGGVIYSQGAQIGARWNQISGDALAEEMVRGGDKWYSGTGKVLPKPPSTDWADTMYVCQGIISFDAVLCHGPRHAALEASSDDTSKDSTWYRDPRAHIPPRVATYSVGGCSGCRTAPERFSKFGSSPLEQFPLLAPPALHASTIKAAKAPFIGSGNKLLLRCMDCLRNRFCESCHKWWCEDCYEIPNQGHGLGPSQPWETMGTTLGGHPEKNVKVHIGLCVEDCLVAEMMSGAGSNGMWG